MPSADAQGARANLHDVFKVGRRWWWVLAVSILMVSGVAVVRSSRQVKQYTATSALLFRDPQLDQKFFGASFFAPTNDAQREAATNVQLVSLDAISRLAANTLRRQGVPVTAADVQNSVAVESAGQSNVVKINVTRPDPREAARVANQFAETYIEFRRNNDRSKVTQAQEIIAQQLAELPSASQQARDLARQDEQLAVLKALQTGNAELVEPAAIPKSPSSPRPKRSAAIGVLLGAMLGVMLILLMERLDRRIRTAEQAQDILKKPVLAGIGLNAALSGSTKAGDQMSALEPFRMLRANLAFFEVARERRTIVVASGSPGDGKTTVAVNLASVAATAGQRVLLVEADLRRPTLAGRIDAIPGLGLSQVLSGQVDFAEAVHHHTLASVDQAGQGAVLDVLLAGTPPPNPAELIGSNAMSRLLQRWEASYDLVVIDTPPITVVSDALLLLQNVQGLVVVVRLNATTRETAMRLREQLATIGVEPLGIVVNGASARGSYYYGGAYGSYAPQASWPAAEPAAGARVPNRRTEV